MTAHEEFLELLEPHCCGAERDRLARYAELLERWAARHNLVRFADRRELVERHLVDALAGAEHMGGEGRLLDIGSGAGLPGIPLLVVRPEWRGCLLEPRQKRWAFLRLVIRDLGLNAEAQRSRYQEFGGAGPWDVIAMRAVGGHRELLAWSRGELSADGHVWLWTTEDLVVELRGESGWRVLSSPLPGLERGRLARLQPCFT
jgi:16S rRNA (guanine527-N7)-methyltransferase